MGIKGGIVFNRQTGTFSKWWTYIWFSQCNHGRILLEGFTPSVKKLLWSSGWLEEADMMLHVLNGGNLMVSNKILKYNLHILNGFFSLWKKAWFTLVIELGLGITDYWHQFEYSTGQGKIHFHSFLMNSIKFKVHPYLV